MEIRARSKSRLPRSLQATQDLQDDPSSKPVEPATGRRTPGRATKPPAGNKLPWPVVVFLVAWVIPWDVQFGPLTMSPYRAVLIVMVLPCLWMCFSGTAGRVRIAYIALLLYCLWGALSLTVLHGVGAAAETGGILFVETMGAYLIARCYIRDADDFRNVVRLLFWIVMFFLPFAILEVVTGRNVLGELFAAILPTHHFSDKEPRWGIRRVQTVFEHPILFGVACGSILSLVHMVLGYAEAPVARWRRSLAVGLTAALSMSSGPWSALAVQAILMGWNWGLSRIQSRWKILLGAIGLVLLVIDIFAKRPLINILFSAFAFDVESAFFRILIWELGTLSVANHPWWGVGLGEWDRPFWMPPSIDMFWLYHAIIYGLPAGILMMLTFFAVVIPVSLMKNLDDKLYQYRAGFLISMAALFLMGWMVHFWTATYELYLFLLGSGVWLLDTGQPGEAVARCGTMARRHTGKRTAIAPTRPARPTVGSSMRRP
jgi:hypothetical protein